MTLAELLCSLRQSLLENLDKDERHELGLFSVTFGTITQALYPSGNRELCIILENLAYSAQHGAMGVQWKARADIPTVEAIISACSEARK